MTEFIMLNLTSQERKIAKKESITFIFNSRTRHRFAQTRRQTRKIRSHNETGRNRKIKKLPYSKT